MEPLRLTIAGEEAGERPELQYAAEEVLRPLGRAAEITGDADVSLNARGLREVFAWLAGAHERGVRDRDQWGRIRFRSMPAQHREAPLATPVDAFRQRLAVDLRQRGVTVRAPSWNGRPWAVCLTHDLDALRTRRLAALVGETLRGRASRGVQRAFGKDDRLRSAKALADLASRHNARATFFVKAGESGKEDVPADPERQAGWFRQLREAGHEIGLHPSIQAATDGHRLARERDRLAAVLGEDALCVRSHFLRWVPEVTPRLYANAGFLADSTLGWSAAPGFRRGTSHPFRLWDTFTNAPSPLWEVPLSLMDTSLFAHQGLSDVEAATALADVFRAARQSGGVAVVLWHNNMDADPRWWDRLAVLDDALRASAADGAAHITLSEALVDAKRGSREEPAQALPSG